MARRLLIGALALLSAFPTFISAQSATFYLEKTETQFSVTIDNTTLTETDAGAAAPNQNADMYIYFTSPAYSWVSIGFGDSMKNALMFVFYPSKDWKNVTISPRMLDGEWYAEPEPYTVGMEILPGTEITKDGMMVVKMICRTCMVWGGGRINTNQTHPFIYAFGPGRQNIHSDNTNAGLSRHSFYGHFTMDMTKTVGKGEVPPPTTAMNGVQLEGSMHRDHDRANLAHAVLGCIAIFLFWPLNVFVGGFLKRIGIHIGVSVVVMVFLVLAYGLGISVSYQYQRTQDYKSPHQIFAFLALLPIALLSLLPIPPIAKLSTYLPRLHTPVSTLTLTTLIITGGVGLNLSSAPRPVTLGYIALSLAVFIICIVLQTCITRRGSAYRRANPRPDAPAPSHSSHGHGFSFSRNGHRRMEDDEQNLALKQYGAPPSYTSEHRDGRGQQQSHERSTSAGSNGSARNIYGGGAMPGPQYMMNMHPGVPVHKF